MKKFYFPFFLLLASLVYTSQRLGIYLPELVNNHLNDFLCIPLVLKIALYAVRHIKSNSDLQIPLALQFCVTVLYCIYFEILLPKVDDRYTADPLDLVAYFLGLIVFGYIERRHGTEFRRDDGRQRV
ncbi:hypothetical protein LV716_18320 [Flagellimonas sp. HMM57]|uniref:hypothetical protein n=1 Tax=unclassified Flagellimonas TaxID=2644544 RepID=UPI0013D1830E|nr:MULTISPECIES: hypothetical protein [unclassified Flagellimonas]UII76195.1 hypothetical protein LV716_18320 [Flagellimonas sp. HMM57]